ncbi:hypothetical protein BCR42DRAFT_428199 [Absidia repens]|uniref:Homeobox domain-containing protein n=1 Tax=Absidia repens TaxID=90262 RepID=A0A1X2HYE7_9FUNG|nr:hypothetical protein BCR42DRAFT_428199 [Absidia repens]
MLSVKCMLNQTQYTPYVMPTCQLMETKTVHSHRPTVLDIASLLCHDDDDHDHDEDLDNSSNVVTPSLSVTSSPLSTSSSMSFTSSPTHNDRSSPYSTSSISPPTTPSTRLSLPPLPPLAYHRTNTNHTSSSLNEDKCHTKHVCCASSSKQLQHHQQNSTYRYQHRLLLMMDGDDNDTDTHSRWHSLERDGDMMMTDDDSDESNDKRIKTKRRRANNKQLQVLNRVFQHTLFPSTQMRAQLGRQLGMSPRTVQIWFQNRRQALRTKERQQWVA